MRQIYTRKATTADAVNLAGKLIGADRIEVEAVMGLPAELCVPQSIQYSVEAYASGFVATPGEVSLLWGVDPVPGHPSVGVVWMLSSPDIYTYPQVFAHHVKAHWDELHTRYDMLTNFTYAENHPHHRVIKWLGGQMIRRVEKYGAAGLPFLEFASVKL